ncbi:hypothetical protein N9A44_00530 [Gammaproteobacteria bacterium]|nr:hypothetical protein [Gammaproteobacteria bacterium]
MKTKLLTIFFLLVTSQAFAEECKGTDVSKWDNCIGKTYNVEGEWSEGLYKNGKKNGFFNDGFWMSRQEMPSDGYHERGHYVNGIRQGLWGYCYERQVSLTYFQIGKYNEKGEREGVWGTFNTYVQDFINGSNGKYYGFTDSGCHVETALYHLNKEDPCSKTKYISYEMANLFTTIDVYKDGELVDSGGVCNHPLLDTTGEYKDTSMFKEWVEILENYEN